MRPIPNRALAMLLAVLLAVGSIAGPAAAEEPDQSGRPAALALTTAYGFYQGVALSILLEENDLLPRGGDGAILTATALTMASTGLGFGLGWWVTDRYGVNEAQSGLFTSGFMWTMLNGVSGGLGVGLDSEALLWNSLVTGWAGQALGILLAANVDRTAGQVSLANTVATWTGAEVAIAQGIFGVEMGSSYLTWSTLAADVGLLVGAYLAKDLDISRGRARLLDLGAFAGALAGPAALFMVWGPEENLREWYLGAVAVGIPIGIGVAWHLTRNLDDDPVEGQAGAMPIMVPLAGGVF